MDLMSGTEILRAVPGDSKLLEELGSTTFWEAYGDEDILEQARIREHIARTFVAESIEAELNDKTSIYLILKVDGRGAGYARLLPGISRDEISSDNALEISRIYLKREVWRKGFGTQLLETCISEAEDMGNKVIWLSVWQHNSRAIAFYSRFGFEIVGEHIFDLAGSEQIDLLMEKGL